MMKSIFGILLLMTPGQVLAQDIYTRSGKETTECSLDDNDVQYLYYDNISQMWRQPQSGLDTIVTDNPLLSLLPVKECLCARRLGGRTSTAAYCLAEFDTCFVSAGKEDPVICSNKVVTLNLVRGAWPFCLFLLIATVYLFFASEVGRRARAYIRRQGRNGLAYIQEQRKQPSSLFSSTEEDDSHNDQRTSSPIDEESPGNRIPDERNHNPSDGIISYPPTAMVVDTTRDSSDLTSTTSPDDTTSTGNATTTITTTTLELDSPTTGRLASSQQQIESTSSSSTIYPIEFGSRSNYAQLVREIYEMHLYEPHRLILLWDSLRLQERRLTLTAARRARLRHFHRLWWNSTTAAAAAAAAEGGGGGETPLEQPHTRSCWWEKQTTIKMTLKTKRFQNDWIDHTEEYEKDIEIDNADNNTLEVRTEREYYDNDSGATDTVLEQQQQRGQEVDGYTCAICLSVLDEGVLVGDIPCSHYFHKDCLKSWLRRSNRCPLCQKENIVAVEVLPIPEEAEIVVEQDDNETSSRDTV